MPAALSPSTIATTFVSIDEGADADIVVRRDRGEFLRGWAFNLTCIALLVAIVPMLVVIWRREPAYFTNGIVVTMLILAVAILIFGLVGAFLWSISKAGRRHFDVPFLQLNAAGVTVRVDDADEMLPWRRVTAMHIFGADDRSLAITVNDGSGEASATDLPVKPGLEPPATPAENNFDYTPPPADWQPSRADFEAISAQPQASDDDQGPEPDASTTKQPDQSATRAAEEAADREPREAHWRRTLYGTPYVVQMRGCTPPLSEIRPIVHSLSRGRVNIPEVRVGVLTRWRRAMLAKRVAKN